MQIILKHIFISLCVVNKCSNNLLNTKDFMSNLISKHKYKNVISKYIKYQLIHFYFSDGDDSRRYLPALLASVDYNPPDDNQDDHGDHTSYDCPAFCVDAS